MSLFSVSVYDSWSKFPNGLLVGTTHQMGVYEECISVHRPIQGKYCMSEVTLTGSNFKITRRDEMETFDHAWSEMLEVCIFVYRNQIFYNKVIWLSSLPNRPEASLDSCCLDRCIESWWLLLILCSVYYCLIN